MISNNSQIWNYEELLSFNFDDLCKIFQEVKMEKKIYKKEIKKEKNNEYIVEKIDGDEVKRILKVKNGIDASGIDDYNNSYYLKLFKTVFG